MNREIQLDGSVAGYERLALLPEAADYGMELDAADTAPFTVAWNSVRKTCEIRIRGTVIAQVDPNDRILRVRDEYPERLDPALHRALNNAVSLTDRLGKVMRELRKSGQIGMVGKEPAPFVVEIENPMHAILGAECVDPNYDVFIHNRGDLAVRYKTGNNVLNVQTEIDGNRITVSRHNYNTMGVKERSFTNLLNRGAAAWQARYNEQRIVGDAHDLAADAQARPIDRESVEREIRARWGVDDLTFKERILNTQVDFGTVEVKMYRGYQSAPLACDIFHNGLRVGRVTADPVCADVTAPFRHVPHIEGAMIRMQEMWMCQVLNRAPEDFPKFDAEDVARLVEDVDMGYGL